MLVHISSVTDTASALFKRVVNFALHLSKNFGIAMSLKKVFEWNIVPCLSFFHHVTEYFIFKKRIWLIVADNHCSYSIVWYQNPGIINFQLLFLFYFLKCLLAFNSISLTLILALIRPVSLCLIFIIIFCYFHHMCFPLR